MSAAVSSPGRDPALAEPVVPLPDGTVQPVTAVRGSVIAASLMCLSEQGYREKYLSLLDDRTRIAILEMTSGQWVNIGTVMRHYEAVDALGLSTRQAIANGRFSIDRVHRSYFGALLRTFGKNFSPWNGLERYPSIAARVLMGGGLAVYRLGPKDARLECHGMPIARYAYVRAGWCGLVQAGVEMTAKRVFVKDVSPRQSENVLAQAVSWV